MNKDNLNKTQPFNSDFNDLDVPISNHDLSIFKSMIEQIFVKVFKLNKNIVPSIKKVDFKKFRIGFSSVKDVDIAIKIQTTQFMDIDFFFCLTYENNIPFLKFCEVQTEENQLIDSLKFENLIGFYKKNGIMCYFDKLNKYTGHSFKYYIKLRRKNYSISDTTMIFSYGISKNMTSFEFTHTNIENDKGFLLNYKELTDKQLQRVLQCHRILQLATDSPMFLELFPMVTLENIRSVNWLEPFLKEFIDSDENIDDKMKILEMISI